MGKQYSYKAELDKEENNMRVVQVSMDIKIDDNADVDEILEYIEKCSSGAVDFTIVGSCFSDDLTDVYEKNYPELLK